MNPDKPISKIAAQVLEYLRENGPTKRSDLKERLGVSETGLRTACEDHLNLRMLRVPRPNGGVEVVLALQKAPKNRFIPRGA